MPVTELDERVLETMSGGDKVRQLLRAKGLTPSLFARRIGVHASAISHELSSRQRSPKVRMELARVLGLSEAEVWALLDGKDIG